jgi:hypothetical protein
MEQAESKSFRSCLLGVEAVKCLSEVDGWMQVWGFRYLLRGQCFECVVEEGCLKRGRKEVSDLRYVKAD